MFLPSVSICDARCLANAPRLFGLKTDFLGLFVLGRAIKLKRGWSTNYRGGQVRLHRLPVLGRLNRVPTPRCLRWKGQGTILRASPRRLLVSSNTGVCPLGL